jgi:hypothetical protein
MKYLEKLNKNSIWIFLLSIPKIIELIKTEKNMETNFFYELYSKYDWFGLITQLITLFILYRVLEQNKRNKERMEVLETVNLVRTKRLFVKSFGNIEIYKSPNETDEQLRSRLPEYGLFKEHIKEEYAIVRDIIQNKMSNKTVEEVENILADFYNQKKTK